MSTSKKSLACSLLLCGTLVASATGLSWADDGRFGLGRSATDAEIRAWDIDIAPTGSGLPQGQGTARDGARIFSSRCSSCHGVTGKEGPAPKLVGGQNTLTTKHPVKTVGSYWPYATTLYDYIRRAMPYPAPQSLTSDDIYAVTAWILAQNGIIAQDAVLDAASLPLVRMPNRNGFTQDPRPDVPSK